MSSVGSSSGSFESPPCDSTFRTTHWSVIERARGPATEAARDALNHLCRAYWKPIYFHARRKGLDHHDANDATQELFDKLLKNEFLESVGPERGRFRTYLLVCLQNHLASRWAKQHAGKRGGGVEHIDLESAAPVRSRERSPDQEFDYQWMLALVSAVMERLKKECELDGRAAQYHVLKNHLVHESDNDSGRVAAEKLGMSYDAVRAALTRLRQRYRELFREEVASTLANPYDADDEIRHLLQVLR